MAKSELNFDPSVVKAQLEVFKSAILGTIDNRLTSEAKDIEAYAKEHKPWTNRTGEARKRLSGKCEQTAPGEWTITLSHGVSYGVFLECCHEGKYAIIQPTLEVKAGAVMKEFDHIIDKFKKGM